MCFWCYCPSPNDGSQAEGPILNPVIIKEQSLFLENHLLVDQYFLVDYVVFMLNELAICWKSTSLESPDIINFQQIANSFNMKTKSSTKKSWLANKRLSTNMLMTDWSTKRLLQPWIMRAILCQTWWCYPTCDLGDVCAQVAFGVPVQRALQEQRFRVVSFGGLWRATAGPRGQREGHSHQRPLQRAPHLHLRW